MVPHAERGGDLPGARSLVDVRGGRTLDEPRLRGGPGQTRRSLNLDEEMERLADELRRVVHRVGFPQRRPGAVAGHGGHLECAPTLAVRADYRRVRRLGVQKVREGFGEQLRGAELAHLPRRLRERARLHRLRSLAREQLALVPLREHLAPLVQTPRERVLGPRAPPPRVVPRDVGGNLERVISRRRRPRLVALPPASALALLVRRPYLQRRGLHVHERGLEVHPDVELGAQHVGLVGEQDDGLEVALELGGNAGRARRGDTPGDVSDAGDLPRDVLASRGVDVDAHLIAGVRELVRPRNRRLR
mmetsp:Transcript_2777/g.11907  ORF Transcript_2777/g.11907 Transcript_2777/m.11907 type:complete len:304 (-) Transcript_2777:1226-2137(-)